MAYLEVLSWHSPGETEQNNDEKLLSLAGIRTHYPLSVSYSCPQPTWWFSSSQTVVHVSVVRRGKYL
jgi:hypothetical protein